MTTVARKFAEYGLGLNFKDLPQEVVKQVKRLLLDTLGCAIGGYTSKASTIIRSVLPEIGGPPESTVIGSGGETSCLNATLANGAMVRYLDFNDLYLAHAPVLSGSHPSEIIPSILAIGERQHSAGEQVVEAIVAGYELSARYDEGNAVSVNFESRGWNMDLRAGFIVPVVAGKLMGLNAEQIENAIGTAGSLNMVLGILDASKEEYTMAKNLRFPLTAYDAILATLLAKRGFTGPKRVFEGSRGYVESVMHGEFNYDKCTDFKGFKIMETLQKSFTADYSTHGHITATLRLVNKYDIKPEDVARIRVWATSRDVEHTGQPEKRYPKNKETADHSSYYLTAIAIMDRAVGPAQFTTEKYEDPRVRELNDKIVSFEADTDIDRFFAAGITEITTKQGKTYKERADYPKGDTRDPMTDEELENKFRGMASVFMNETQVKETITAVNNVDKVKNIGDLMRLLVFRD
jgi:2-methylcitrate dehydratase